MRMEIKVYDTSQSQGELSLGYQKLISSTTSEKQITPLTSLVTTHSYITYKLERNIIQK